MIEYILDKYIRLLDSNKEKFYFYKRDIDIIKNFEGFRILNNGTYQYKGYDIVILDKEEDNNKE